MPIASTTAEVAEAAQLSPETVLRMRRDPNGPFKQHRDWQYIGLGKLKIRWSKEQALQSLWDHKRQPAAEVETFSASGSAALTGGSPMSVTTDWRSRLLPQLAGLPLVPCGAGDKFKAPMDPATGYPATDWQIHGLFPRGDRGDGIKGAVCRHTPWSTCRRHCGRRHRWHPSHQQTIELGADHDPGGTLEGRKSKQPPSVQAVLPCAERSLGGSPGKVVIETETGENIEIFWDSGQCIVAGEHRISGGEYTLARRHPSGDRRDPRRLVGGVAKRHQEVGSRGMAHAGAERWVAGLHPMPDLRADGAGLSDQRGRRRDPLPQRLQVDDRRCSPLARPSTRGQDLGLRRRQTNRRRRSRFVPGASVAQH